MQQRGVGCGCLKTITVPTEDIVFSLPISLDNQHLMNTLIYFWNELLESKLQKDKMPWQASASVRFIELSPQWSKENMVSFPTQSTFAITSPQINNYLTTEQLWQMINWSRGSSSHGAINQHVTMQEEKVSNLYLFQNAYGTYYSVSVKRSLCSWKQDEQT